MRASLEVGGIEVELSVAAGPLEVAIATRYARFLRSVQAPACALRIEPATGVRTIGPSLPVVERAGPTRFDVAHPLFSGSFDLAGDGVLWTTVELPAADEALGIVFALVAPEHDGILMHAAGVIRARKAGIYLGPAAASMVREVAEPTLGEGFVLVRRLPGTGWVAAATPFGAAGDESLPPRMAGLDRIWLRRRPGHDVTCASDVVAEVALSAVIPTADPGIRDSVLTLTRQLVAAVPTADVTDRCRDIPGATTNTVSLLSGRPASMARPGRLSNSGGVTTP